MSLFIPLVFFISYKVYDFQESENVYIYLYVLIARMNKHTI